MRYILSICLLLGACSQEISKNVHAQDIYVIDGDSIRYNDENTRLSGFDTPETRGAKCEAERVLAYEAKAYLRNIIDASDSIRIQLHRKRDGEPKRGKYGRLIADLYVDGANVASLMISQGFARPYNGGKRQGWCS